MALSVLMLILGQPQPERPGGGARIIVQFCLYASWGWAGHRLRTGTRHRCSGHEGALTANDMGLAVCGVGLGSGTFDLSHCTLVIADLGQAPSVVQMVFKSGSLIFDRLAGEFDRDLFAKPLHSKPRWQSTAIDSFATDRS